jgi:hypothetical protein
VIFFTANGGNPKMLNNTLEDDIHSALNSIYACANAVKLCDNAVNHENINLVIKKINKCARIVKHCDSILRDHRGLRASKPGRATAWEIRTTLGLPENANISKYSGKVNPDGSVDVWDDEYYGKRGGKLIGHAEASALDEAVMHKSSIGTFAAGYTPGTLAGGFSGMKNSINQVANKGIGSFVGGGRFDPSQDKSALVRALGQVGKIVALTGQIAGMITMIRFAQAGNNMAEGLNQVKRFKNWATKTAKDLANKINGRR